MFVCICNAVTDRQIQELVDAGAQSLSDLKTQLGVATCCGCCSDLAASYLGVGNARSSTHAVSAIRVDM